MLEAVTRDLKTQKFDHIAVTGDLVNLSLPDEYAAASAWLAALGNGRDVTVVPGNHDVYIRAVEQTPAYFWGDYMRGDDGLDRFPFVRRRGNVALIGLSTGVATGPFMAKGWLGARQLARLADVLQETRGAFRVVLIHHPPYTPLRRYLRRLVDAAALRRVLADKGAELLLHGHDHRASLILLDGPNGKKIPASRRAVGVGAMRRTATKTAPAIICSRSTVRTETGAATCARGCAARTAPSATASAGRSFEHDLIRKPDSTFRDHALAPARHRQSKNDQRHHAEQKTEHQRAEGPPAAPPAVTRGVLRRYARGKRGIVGQRALPFDQTPGDILVTARTMSGISCDSASTWRPTLLSCRKR